MRLLLRWALDAVAVIVILYVLPHLVVTSVLEAIVIAVVLGLVNAMVRPVFVLLDVPLNVATLGIFVLVVNAALFELFQLIFGGFDVLGLLWLALATVVVALVTTVINIAVAEE